MFALIKPFILALAVIVLLLFLIGVIRIEKNNYACFNGRHLRFSEKTKLLDIGSLKIYSYPLIYDCPIDEQYDPASIYLCEYKTYCQK